MTGDRRKQAEELFQTAVDLPAGERGVYLQERCGSDGALRVEVDRLLGAHDAVMGDFLKSPAVGEPAEPGERPGDRIGPYKLLGHLGQGAFGDVYVAQQIEPLRRIVALKIVKLGMDTKQVVARFEAERQALALMEHPHIAKVYDAGATELGRPYFVMEYMPGVPLTEYCDSQRLPIKQRLRLFLDVCDAIQHAHQKGIIHRDVKPTNILVQIVGDRPVLRVIDFGIAKATGYSLTERTLFTDHGQLIGTPEYMSPEQAQGGAQGVDTRTDIYALGVVLYELLTGTLPFEPTSLRTGTVEDIQNRIREEHPDKPSTRIRALGSASSQAAKQRRTNPQSLRRRLRGELDWITMKAMEKDRTRRYGAASELAADIQRHLDHEPVVAGPPSGLYKLKKYVRRNRSVVIAAVVVFAGLTWGTIGTAVGLVAAQNEKQAIVKERDRARRAVYLAVSLILQRLSDAEVSPLVLEDLYWALSQAFGEPADGMEETISRIQRFVAAQRLLSLGLSAEAEVILVSLKEWVDGQFNPGDIPSVMISELLADARIKLHKFAEAQTLAEDTYRGYRDLFGPDAPGTRRSIERLIGLYDAWGRPAEADRWRQELSEVPEDPGGSGD